MRRTLPAALVCVLLLSLLPKALLAQWNPGGGRTDSTNVLHGFDVGYARPGQRLDLPYLEADSLRVLRHLTIGTREYAHYSIIRNVAPATLDTIATVHAANRFSGCAIEIVIVGKLTSAADTTAVRHSTWLLAGSASSPSVLAASSLGLRDPPGGSGAWIVAILPDSSGRAHIALSHTAPFSSTGRVSLQVRGYIDSLTVKP
jgi:hypothetical protein